MAQTSVEEIRALIKDANEAGDTDAVQELTGILNRRIGPKPPEDRELGFGEAAYQGAWNIPSSAVRTAGHMVEGVGQMVQHPIESAEAMRSMAQGGLDKADVWLSENLPDWLKPPGQDPRAAYVKAHPEDMQSAEALGEYAHSRGAGSWKNFKRTLAEDPVGLGSDLAGIVMPVAGGARALPGVLGRVAGRTARVAEAAQPANILAKPVPAILRRLPVVGEEAPMARMRRLAPTAEQRQAESTRRYSDLTQQGIQIQPEAFRNLVTGVNAEIGPGTITSDPATVHSRGVIEAINRNMQGGQAPLQAEVQAAQARVEAARAAARASAATGSPSAARDAQNVRFMEAELAQAQARARRGPPLPFEAAEAARREALAVNRPGRETADVGLSNRVLGHVEQAFDTLPQLPEVRAAREAGRTNLLAHVLNRIEGSPERVSGYESSMRNQVQAFLKQRGHTLTAPELRDFNQIVAREGLQNTMHMLASRLGLLAGVAGGVAGTHNPLLGASAAVGANIAARTAAERLTHSQMQKALQTVLAGREAQTRAWRRRGIRRGIYSTLGRGAAAVGTYARPYGEMTE